MSLKAQVELFINNIAELKEYFPMHWAETVWPNAKEELDFDYFKYLKAEDQDVLTLITLRDDKKMAGYFIGFKMNSLHSKDSIHMIQDMLFIDPQYRGKNGFKILTSKIEEECKKMNVDRIFVGSRGHNDAGKLFERAGYDLADVYYSKYIGN